MKLLISSDHGGYKLKEHLKSYLLKLGVFEVEDYGPTKLNPDDDYPDFVMPLVQDLLKDTKNKRAVLICRNAVGVCLSANKYKGVRAGISWDAKHAKTARADDNMNVLCLPSDFLKEDAALEVLNSWLETEFSYDVRHLRRLNKISILGTGNPSESIIPCIFEPSWDEIKRKIKLAENHTDLIQVDFADGQINDGKTYLDMYELGNLELSTKLEIHLMIKNPITALHQKIKNVTKVCSQVEAENIDQFISKAKELGYLVGLSLDLNTNVTELDPYIKKLDYVQIMTISAGGKGRSFDLKSLKKIGSIRKNYPILPIQVDGGMNAETLPLVIQAGANAGAVNTAFFKNDTIKNNLEILLKAIND